jgi:DNA sulfur modification protein DndB
MTSSFEYHFPAIKGVQARREYYVSMCPLKLIPKLFIFDEEELVPELRAQRVLNKVRVPEMATYITENPDSYVFSAITASIDGDATFEALETGDEFQRIGILRVPMQSQFIINDGQHRRAAIEAALKARPALGDESIAVVFFMDRGLTRCQQMFADLNRYAVKPSASLGLLYDHRDQRAHLARMVVQKSDTFKNLVEMEKTSLSPRSRKLFTLSAVYTANSALIGDADLESLDDLADSCADFWDEIAQHIPEWGFVRQAKMTAGEVRRDFIHSHSIVLQVLGEVGHMLQSAHPKDWRKRASGLASIDWSRSNSTVWEGRALLGGRVSKARQNVLLTKNAVKQHLRLPLSPEEHRLEEAFKRGEHVQVQ